MEDRTARNVWLIYAKEMFKIVLLVPDSYVVGVPPKSDL